jgi:uncharacterized protein (DUF1684 family)
MALRRTILLVTVTALLGSLSAAPLGSEGTKYSEQIASWRGQEEQKLKTPDGWLTVVGLSWLKKGRNNVGSQQSAEVALPAGAPPHAGYFERQGNQVRFFRDNGSAVRWNGEPMTAASVEMKLAANGPDKIQIGTVTLAIIQRGARIGVRVRDTNSPYRQQFAGMHWFPVTEKMRLEAKWLPAAPGATIAVPNILGDVTAAPAAGTAVFTVNGAEYRLTAVPEDEQLFFVFGDATNQHQTYGGGRFLYADKPSGDHLTLDFNQAVSPPCAWTPYATCPLPPRENKLPIAIEAGEMYVGKRH